MYKSLFSTNTITKLITNMSSSRAVVTKAKLTTTTKTDTPSPVVKKTPSNKKTTKTTIDKSGEIVKKETTTTTTTTTTATVAKDTVKTSSDGIKRCFWVGNNKSYLDYHDNEWGQTDKYDTSLKLFEKICLEGQQCGLSWITVLLKREEYRRCFYNFDPEEIVKKVTPKEIDKLLLNAGLIRNRLKLEAIVSNAKAYLRMVEKGEDLHTLLWSIVGNKTTIGKRIIDDKTGAIKPLTRNEYSDEIARVLKEKGFKFIGTTTLYAFMQSVGMINDHQDDCTFNPKKKLNKQK